jgi:hypothetical protein
MRKAHHREGNEAADVFDDLRVSSTSPRQGGFLQWYSGEWEPTSDRKTLRDLVYRALDPCLIFGIPLIFRKKDTGFRVAALPGKKE